MHTHTSIQKHAHTHANIHTQRQCTQVQTHVTHTCTYTLSHIHAHKYTNICSPSKVSGKGFQNPPVDLNSQIPQSKEGWDEPISCLGWGKQVSLPGASPSAAAEAQPQPFTLVEGWGKSLLQPPSHPPPDDFLAVKI